MIILLIFSFLAGFVTILAPCIWPLLPIVLSASSGTGKRKPLGITLGVMTSFTVFTLSISYLERIFHLDPNIFRLLAVIIIGLLGVSMLIPSLGARFEIFINHLLSPLQNKFKKQGTGFWAGYGTGFSIGLVWAPCAGPILATIATLAATQAVDIRVVAITLAYVTGLGIPLFFISLAGSWCFSRMRQFTKYTGRVQQVFGVVMIAAALLIYTNYDKTIQIKILNLFPSYGNLFNKIENNETVAKELQALRGEKEITVATPTDSEALPDLGPAADFVGITQWLNTSSELSLASLRGKVVLVDFWTYTCVNCVRTLPHVTGWYEKYKDNGFVVVGVHAPEFAFEKSTANVESAIKQFKINYPVAQDNDFKTWKNYKNHYWPAEYLIDATGHLRRTHFGEGKYDEMERAIRQLLMENGQTILGDLSSGQDQTPQYARTPETYLGAARMERFSSPEGKQIGVTLFTKPAVLPPNRFFYEGTWDLEKEYAKAILNAALEIKFKAGKVFLVIGPKNPGDQIKVFIDGNPVKAEDVGKDVFDGVITLDSERLYEIIDLKSRVELHTLRLEFQNKGIIVYAFTFG